MTVSSDVNRTSYTGSGSAGPFNIGFTVSSDEAFAVTKVLIADGTQTTLTLNAGSSGYTVNAALTQITLTETISASYRLVITLNEAITQEVDFLANNAFPSEVNEQALDKLTRIDLQQQEELDRCVKLPIGSSATGVQIPDPDEGKALIWESDTLVNSTDNFNDIVTDAAASASAAASSASAASGSASSASSSASSASTSASNASTSASAAATSASNASTSASTATTQASNASTSASNALTSENNAASSAAQAIASQGALKFTFDSSTSMADPGSGEVRLNNATVASVTAIAFSANNAASGNPDVSDYIVTWDDSTHSVKGSIVLTKSGTPATFAIFHVNGSVTDNTSWLQVPVTYVTGNGTLSAADSLFFMFAASGNDGAGAGDMNDVIDDTTPQLGGNLDVNGFDITSPDGTDLVEIVNGTVTVQTDSSSRIDITDSGVRLGGANARVTTILDEDTMASDSATALATQQSIKAYVDANAGGGAWSVIQTQTASTSASLSFTSIANSTYDTHVLVASGVRVTSAGAAMTVLASIDAGSTYLTTNEYDYHYQINQDSSGAYNASGSSASASIICTSDQDSAATSTSGFVLYLHNLSNATTHKAFNGTGVRVDTGTVKAGDFYGAISTTSDIDALRVIPSAGNILSGRFTLYGIAHS